MTRIRSVLAVAAFLAPVAALAIDPKSATPPVAKTEPYKTKLHGEERTDNYFWLKDKKNPEVIKYLDAENAYTATVMRTTEELQSNLYKESLARIKQTDLSVPYKNRGFWYYTRTEEGKQYPIYCRKAGTLEAPEELLLDVNELAKGEKFMSVSGVEVSDDGTRVAFLSDTTGFREYHVSVKDLKTGKMLENRFVKAPNTEWAADNKTLFYTTEDEAKRSHKLWRHTIGEPKEKDVLVAEEKDELFRLGVSRTRDGKYLLRSCRSSTTAEVWFLPADQPTGEWKVIATRQDGHDYSIDHRAGAFFIRTNKDKATNFKAMTCPVDKTDPAGWTELIRYNPAVMVNGVSVFKNFAVISEREAGVPHLRFYDFRDGQQHRVVFPEAIYSVGLGRNPDFDAASVHMSYTSLVTPSTVYEYDPATKVRKVLKKTEVLGGYDPDEYATEWVFATATDGTKVPISMVYKKGYKRDGQSPCLLYAYGSYGATMPVAFNASRLALLDRGVVYATAHIRGGSDMGRQWYDDGKMLKKMNTFTDFIACADFLVKEKYCDRGKLVIQGGSAGGLLVGATINLRPDVCKAAVLQVPFVDVVTTMLDESLPLTVQEFLEWGNPKVKAEYEYMKTYDPYANLTKAKYPAILVTTSLNDSQVLFHEPTKYVAKMRSLNPDAQAIVFKCNMAGGHGGSSGRYDSLKEQAFVMSFVLDQMGITK
jgi:oligopeptidase B